MCRPSKLSIKAVFSVELKTSNMQKTWAISAYFNPMGYESRKNNFEVFREHLQIPLLVVEFSHDGQFQIGENDCDRLIQLSAGDVLWQKEALLNAGIAHLDDACENVVFLDADVVFTEGGWVEQVNRVLEDNVLLQPFQHVLDLSQVDTDQLRSTGRIADSMVEPRSVEGVRTELDGFRLGFAKAWNDGALSKGYFTSWETRNVVPTAPGFGMAGKKAFFQQNPLYDGAIIGGGDNLELGCRGRRSSKRRFVPATCRSLSEHLPRVGESVL